MSLQKKSNLNVSLAEVGTFTTKPKAEPTSAFRVHPSGKKSKKMNKEVIENIRKML